MHAVSPDPSKPANPRRKLKLWPRRWVPRALVLLLAVLVAVVVITQIVLWTNVPRDLVIERLEKQLGLRIQAASLSTGWLGNTHLRDVSIALPLSDEALLRVPRMRVKHTSLFGLLWTRAVDIDAVELDDPYLLVRQDVAGRWNLQEVADLLARTGGKQTASEQAAAGAKSSRPTLPALRITGATVEVLDRTGRKTAISPVNVTGVPENVLTWRYDVGAGTVGSASGPQVSLKGRLVTGGNWEHQVDALASHLQKWAQPWAGAGAPGISIAGQWHGRRRSDGGGVAGRLVVSRLDVGNVHVTGAAAVSSEGGTIALRPETLLVQTPHKPVPDLRITGGKLAVDGKSVTADSLTALVFDGAAQVNGRYDWAAGAADLSATWAEFVVPNQRVTHGGSFTASLRTPITGRHVECRLVSNGKMPSGGWDADVTLRGSGRSSSEMDWQLGATRLQVTSTRELIRLDGLAAAAQTRGSLVTLTSLRGPGEVVARGRGQYDFASRNWNVRVDLANLPRPVSFGRQTPLEITLSARGTAERIVLEQPGVSLRGSEAELRIDGSYVYDIPKPVDFNVYVNHVPRRPGAADDRPPIFGYLRGEGKVLGTLLHPTNLSITGHLVGRDVRFLDRPVGEFETGVTGQIDDERLVLQTQKTQLLGGQWQIDALFPEQGVLGMNVTVNGLSLERVGEAFKQPSLKGSIDARWALIIPRLQAEAVKMTGDVKGRGVSFGKVISDTLEASVVLADGALSVDPVRLRKGEGEARFAAELDVREFRRLTASLDLAAWPFEPQPGTKAELWGGTGGPVRVTFPGAVLREGIRRGVFRPETKAERLWVMGPVDLRASFTLKDQPAGDLRLIADLRGRSIDLRSLAFDGLDGTVQGQGVIDFDRPFEARGSVYFEDFNGARIPEYFPENKTLPGIAGRYSGSVRIGPAPGPRPLQPLRIQGHVTNVGGKYRSVDVGPIRFSAFTNLDRLVIEDSPENPTTIDLAGGLVRVWGRFSMLEPGDELKPMASAAKPIAISQLQVSFGRLDLDQIVHAFKPDAEPMVGKLAGSFEALAGTRTGRRPGEPPSGQGPVEKIVRRITADGRIELTETDLANFDLVAFFYNAMSVAGQPQQPEGRGDVTFHLEDGLLSLHNAHYFNRGIELRGIVDIDQVWRMPDSPVDGTAVGTARPFRDIRLPFLSTYDLDTILTVLQTDLTTSRMTGTVRAPVIEPLTFSDVGEGMRMFILGDFQKENRTRRRR